MDYQMGRLLGAGGFSTVYSCTRKSDGKEFAAKVFEKAKLEENDYRNIITEVKIMRMLNHRNIVKLIDFVEDSKHYCIIMELCCGISLYSYIITCPCTNIKIANFIASQIINAVNYLHSNNISHLDLKPENIIIDKETNIIKIIDFGLSVAQPSQCTVFRGSLTYASPERLAETPYNAFSADCWSIGVIAYILSTGTCPWPDDQTEMIRAISTAKYKPIKSENNMLNSIITATLKVNPDERATAEQLLAMISVGRPKTLLMPTKSIPFGYPKIVKPCRKSGSVSNILKFMSVTDKNMVVQ